MTMLRVELNTPLKLALASELARHVYYISDLIVSFELIEDNKRIRAINLELRNDTELDETQLGHLSEKINNFVSNELVHQRVISQKKIWQTANIVQRIPPYNDRLFDILLKRGMAFEMGEGQIALGEPLISLMDYFDRQIKLIALSFPEAESYQYPTLLPIEVLDRFGYFESFPQLLMYTARLHNDLNTYRNFLSDYSNNKNLSQSLYSHSHNEIHYCLPPTMCYHTYHQLQHQPLKHNRVVTAKGKSFRFENKYHHSMERLWDFTIREIVFLGTREFVLDCRQRFMNASFALIEALELAGYCEVATDPFFVPSDTVSRRISQHMLELKYELRLHVTTERTIAVGSFNFHEAFFGNAFDIQQDNGETAITGCVGFGLERLVYAFLCQYGLDETQWPDAVRERRDIYDQVVKLSKDK